MTFAQPRTAGQITDFISTVLLLGLQGLVYAFSVWFSLFFVMATGSCTADACNTDLVMWAYVVTDGGGTLIMLAATVGASILLARRRLSFWVPVLGLALQIAVFFAGLGLVSSVSA